MKIVAVKLLTIRVMKGIIKQMQSFSNWCKNIYISSRIVVNDFIYN